MENFSTCHSHPASLDTGSTPEAFVAREVALGTGTVTCTDHGTLAACRKIYNLAKKNKLIPIMGMEGYLRDDDCPILTANGYAKNDRGAFTNAPKYMHFCVHFMDQTAYECGVRLLSDADARLETTLEKLEAKDRRHGKERKPLFTWRDLEELGALNVTMTTGCMIGVVQRHLFDNNDLRTAEAYFDKLQAIVKPGNLYTELNPHDTSKDWIEGVFLTMADGTKQRFYKDKVLMTDVDEVSAIRLAQVWAKGEHHVLKSVKDRSKWREIPEQEIKLVEHLEGFFQNECKQWAPDGDYQAGLNRAMRALARRRGVKIMIGDDSHYATPDEKVVQDVRLAQDGPWRFYGSYHRQSSDEAFAYFNKKLGISEAEFQGWVANSKEWAARFKGFVFDTPPSLPTRFYETEYEKHGWFKGVERDNSLRYTLELIKKHGRMDWGNPAYAKRLRAEIDLLHNNGTIDLLPYFMIDEEVCGVYEKAGLLTGPGRGSAAGLLLTYLLGITHVEPLRYDLSLDRFITLDRIRSGKLPDVDQDLPHRDLLVDPVDPTKGWLKDRFGDYCAQLSTDTTLKLSSAVRDVSRMERGHVPPDIEKWGKKFVRPPQGVKDYKFVMGYETDDGIYHEGSKEFDPSLREYIRKYPEDWKTVQKCLGLTRQKGRHPCAFIIANKPIQTFIPLTTVGDVRVTAYTASSVEEVGGLKMDFLVINSLNDISDAIKIVQRRSPYTAADFVDRIIDGKRVPGHRLLPLKVPTAVPFDPTKVDSYKLVDIWDLPEDQAVFADVATSKTESVFQYNTPAARSSLHYFSNRKANGNYAIDSVEAMSAFTALDRPGPLKMFVPNPDMPGKEHNLLVEYARRAAGQTPSPGILKVFDEFIPETNGVMVYQEQLQRMYQQLTGCTGPEAEEFRSNVAKKKKEKIDEAYPFFIEKATAKIGRESALAAWQFFLTWAEYGFNKSVDQATILQTCDGHSKKLEEFRSGDLVWGIDDCGRAIKTEVLALHDHGTIPGFEVTFDDGASVTVSANHKFLTPLGQVALATIADRDLEVLCEPTTRPPDPSHGLRPNGALARSGDPQEGLRRVPSSGRAEATPAPHEAQRALGDLAGLRFEHLEGRCYPAQGGVRRLLGDEASQHLREELEAQPESGAAHDRVRDGQDNVCPTRYTTPTRRASASLAGGPSRRDPSYLGEGQEGCQAIQDGGVVEIERNPCLGRSSNTVSRSQETGGLRLTRPQDLGGSGRLLPLLSVGERSGQGALAGQSPSSRRDAETRMRPTRGCDVDPASRKLLSLFGRQDEGHLAGVVYSDAPLASTRGLVLRRVVRVRSVGPRRMYDLEVSHPKHNFLLPNGVITSNSHAVCYAVLGYACAFIKHYYPLEWWTAVLCNASKNEVSNEFWRHCGHLIDLPDVKLSGANFEIQGERIRAPLKLLQGVGPGAHAQLNEYAPYTDIADFCKKIDDHQRKHGVTTMVKKTKKERFRNAAGKMESRPIEVEVSKLKRGHNSLNRGVVQKMILTGAMDSLFPPDMHVGDQLNTYEDALHAATGQPRKPVPPELWDVGPIARYQKRKEILPAFAQDIVPLLVAAKVEGLSLIEGADRADDSYQWTWVEPNYDRTMILDVASATELEFAEVMELPDGQAITIAVAAYVEDVEIKGFGDEGRERAIERLDVGGGRYEYVQWPRKDQKKVPDMYRLAPPKGAVVVAVLNRWRADKPFSIQDMVVVAPPLKKVKDDKGDSDEND